MFHGVTLNVYIQFYEQLTLKSTKNVEDVQIFKCSMYLTDSKSCLCFNFSRIKTATTTTAAGPYCPLLACYVHLTTSSVLLLSYVDVWDLISARLTTPLIAPSSAAAAYKLLNKHMFLVIPCDRKLNKATKQAATASQQQQPQRGACAA